MHKTAAEALSYLDVFLPLAGSCPKDIEILVAPPFTAIPAAGERLRGEGRVALGAQNVHWELQGAFTGEVSVPMLVEHGVTHVIVGHSERRAYCGETDLTVNLKIRACLAHGLTPIVAVGELLEEREKGKTDERIGLQIDIGLQGLSREQLSQLVIAYEPIWAIGTGQNCDPAEANHVMGLIRSLRDGLNDVPILYGGSMNAQNVAQYMRQQNINGGLVGGASLDPAGFATLITNGAAQDDQDDKQRSV